MTPLESARALQELASGSSSFGGRRNTATRTTALQTSTCCPSNLKFTIKTSSTMRKYVEIILLGSPNLGSASVLHHKVVQRNFPPVLPGSAPPRDPWILASFDTRAYEVVPRRSLRTGGRQERVGYASSNKCIASSNKCLTSSNKKLLVFQRRSERLGLHRSERVSPMAAHTSMETESNRERIH